MHRFYATVNTGFRIIMHKDVLHFQVTEAESLFIILSKSHKRLHILDFKIPLCRKRPLNSSVIRRKQVTTLFCWCRLQGKHFLKLKSGLMFDSQTQCKLVSLDLSVLVDVAVTQQDGSQLDQLRTRHVGLQWGEKVALN